MRRRWIGFGVAVLLALPGVAPAQRLIGEGGDATIATGPGLDLVVWNEQGRLRAVRVDAAGNVLENPPLLFGTSAGVPSAAWDGAAFLVVWPDLAPDGGAAMLARIGADGSLSSPTRIADGASATAVGSAGDGRAFVAWTNALNFTLRGRVLNAGLDPLAGEEILIASSDAVGDLEVTASEEAYLVTWTGQNWCTNTCVGPYGPGFLRRVSFDGTPIGLVKQAGTTSNTLITAAPGLPLLLAIYDDWWSPPMQTRVLRLGPDGLAITAGTVRFAEPLRAAHGGFLVGFSGIRFLPGPRLRLEEALWVPLDTDEILVDSLSHSGHLLTESFGGEITLRRPASDRFDVAMTITHLSPTTVWLKTENRGPDAPRGMQFWIHPAGGRITTMLGGEISRVGDVDVVRIDDQFLRGGGFEVYINYEEPIDPATFEAWFFANGTDVAPENNHVPATEETTGRRRAAARIPWLP